MLVELEGVILETNSPSCDKSQELYAQCDCRFDSGVVKTKGVDGWWLRRQGVASEVSIPATSSTTTLSRTAKATSSPELPWLWAPLEVRNAVEVESD